MLVFGVLLETQWTSAHVKFRSTRIFDARRLFGAGFDIKNDMLRNVNSLSGRKPKCHDLCAA